MIVEKYDEKEFFDKSIKMLEKDYGNNFANDFKELYIKQQEEIERLNKGIKELDNMFYETFRISQNGYYSISEWVLKEFTDKLQELKGSDK